jgi:hypothetical protein
MNMMTFSIITQSTMSLSIMTYSTKTLSTTIKNATLLLSDFMLSVANKTFMMNLAMQKVVAPSKRMSVVMEH